jgi:hypothetical protein
VPAGAVEHHDGVGVGRDGGGEVEKEAVHRFRADPRQNEAEVLARCGPDGGEEVGRGETLVGEPGRALALDPPAVTRPAFLAHAGLVHEPKRDLLARMGLGGGRYGVAKPLWAKASAARPFRFG